MTRVQPAHEASAYKTFQIVSPKKTHLVKATCEEAECASYKNGWRMKLDLGTPLGQQQAHYIKHISGRSYKVIDQRDGLVVLEFSGGQPCFTQHEVRNELPEIFRIKGGDFRGNPLGTPTRTTKPELWIEEFAENQAKIAEAIEKG